MSLLLAFFLAIHLGNLGENPQQKLYQKAKVAERDRDLEGACRQYEKLLEQIGRRYTSDWPSYVDAVVSLCRLYQEMGLLEKSQKQLEDLLRKSPPPTLRAKASITLAELKCALGEPLEAYRIMRSVLRTLPLEQWTSEERSFFKGLAFLLKEHVANLKKRGDALLRLGSWEEASSIYLTLLSEVESGRMPCVIDPDRLYLQLGRCYMSGSKWEELFALPAHETDEWDALLGSALYEAHRPRQALSHFEALAKRGSESPRQKLLHAKTLLRLGDQHQAKALLKELCLSQRDLECVHLAHLLLAKCYLKEKRPKKCEALLAPIAKSATTFREEIRFYRGMAAAQAGEVGLALQHFEKLQENAPKWKAEALFWQGWATMGLGKKPYQSAEAKKILFNKAEELFLLAKSIPAHAVALGELFLLQGKENKLDALFSTELIESLPLDLQVQALLQLAYQANPDRHALLQRATAPIYASTPLYGEAWLQRGLASIEIGAYPDAAEDLKRAFSLLEGKKSKRFSLQKAAECYALASLADNALSLIDTLIEQEGPTPFLLYLKGVIAISGKQIPIAKRCFKELLKSETPFQARSFYALGTLYEKELDFPKAQAHFLKAANANTSFPEQDQAMFRSFSLHSYEQGDPLAIAHLERFLNTFPLSTLSARAWLLLAANMQAPEERFNAYRQAAYTPHPTPSRQAARLALAKLHLQEGSLQECRFVLELLLEDEPTSTTSLAQEAEMQLANCLIQEGKNEEAAAHLKRISTSFALRDIVHSSTLALVEEMRGELAFQKGAFTEALRHAKAAERAGEGTLSKEAFVSILHLKSRSLFSLKRFDEALLTSSQMINTECASKLRLEAMKMRALIYAKEGKQELAIRALEALAKKGGEPAKWAEKKLEEEYGICEHSL